MQDILSEARKIISALSAERKRELSRTTGISFRQILRISYQGDSRYGATFKLATIQKVLGVLGYDMKIKIFKKKQNP